MRRLLSIAVLALCAMAAQAEHRCIVGISPFLQKAEKDEIFRRIAGFLLEDAPLGSSLWIYDAYHLRTIALMDIPDVRAFRSGKTRANQFKRQIGKLRDFLASEHAKPEAPNLDFNRAVRFPQFMEFVGQNLVKPGRPAEIIVLGSPLYLDAKEPTFSMAGGAFPSDGHLLADRDRSVYGVKTQGGALEGVSVHYCWFGDPWASEVHREKVARFWSLYLTEQGAELATFCGDLATVFNAVKSPAASAERDSRYMLDRSAGKIEMLRVTREIASGDWITRDAIPNAATTPPETTTGPMKIGIRWSGELDLDLYATPAPGAETLFFENTRTAEGYYFKDHRSSPNREYEYIEFEAPVDAWKVQARVNFFEGRAAHPPEGEVRVEFAGRIYTGAFELAAQRGNEGRAGAGQEDWWFEIDLAAILRLRDAPQARASAAR